MTARVRERVLENPQNTLFAAEKVEANIRRYADELQGYNDSMGRSATPIRMSIDEWNCRHSVWNGSGYSFTRKDARRLYDAAAIAAMLNAFIHTSPHLGMANYIFPVNGHGLLKTVGGQDAYETPAYYVFDLYRRFMKGSAVGVNVTGPGQKAVNLSSLSVEGDCDTALRGVTKDFCYVGCAAAVDDEGRVAVALVNRSYDTPQRVSLSVKGEGSIYEVAEAWSVTSSDVLAENTAESRDAVVPQSITLSAGGTLVLAPCAVAVVVLKKAGGEDAVLHVRQDGSTSAGELYSLAGAKLPLRAAKPSGMYVSVEGSHRAKVAMK